MSIIKANAWQKANGTIVGTPIQTLQVAKTNVYSTTSTSYVDATGLSITITPSSASSKILVIGQIALGSSTTERYSVFGRLARGGNPIFIADVDGSRDRGTFSYQMGGFEGPMMQPIFYLDSPATNLAVTYSIQIRAESPHTAYINRGVEADGDIIITPRTTSSITVMEIQA